jgi:hypothetical protein
VVRLRAATLHGMEPRRTGTLVDMTQLALVAAVVVLGLAAGFLGARVGGRGIPTALALGTIVLASVVAYASTTGPYCSSTIDCEPVTTTEKVLLDVTSVGVWWVLVAIGAALAWRFQRLQERDEQ